MLAIVFGISAWILVDFYKENQPILAALLKQTQSAFDPDRLSNDDGADCEFNLPVLQYIFDCKKLRVEFDPPKNCLTDTQIDLSALREKISQLLDVKIVDTADDAPRLLISWRALSSFLPNKSWVLLKMTLIEPESQDVDLRRHSYSQAFPNKRAEEIIVFRKQKVEYVEASPREAVKAAIEIGLRDLNKYEKMAKTDQRPEGTDQEGNRLKMYEAPTKKIDGLRAPSH